MFTWHVPKYEDYVKTPLEQAATIELKTGLKVRSLFTNAIREYAKMVQANVEEGDIEFYFVAFWCMLHGFISGNNNTILSYMHENPMELKDQILAFVLERMAHLVVTDHRKPSLKRQGRAS